VSAAWGRPQHVGYERARRINQVGQGKRGLAGEGFALQKGGGSRARGFGGVRAQAGKARALQKGGGLWMGGVGEEGAQWGRV
jgi:hypothetical protein